MEGDGSGGFLRDIQRPGQTSVLAWLLDLNPQNAIDRLLAPSITPDNLSPTSLPTLRLDFTRLLIRLRDWESASQQLDLIGSIDNESLIKDIAQLRETIREKKELPESVDGQIMGGPRTVMSEEEESTTVLLNSETAKELQTGARCGEPYNTCCLASMSTADIFVSVIPNRLCRLPVAIQRFGSDRLAEMCSLPECVVLFQAVSRKGLEDA